MNTTETNDQYIEMETNAPSHEVEDETISTCIVCGGTPCEWIEHGPALLLQAENMFREYGLNEVDTADVNQIPNHRKRKCMYKLFTYLKYGHLGKGNRIPIPCCVEDKIRENWPEESENYMGYLSE